MPVGGGAPLPRFVGMTPFGPLPQAPKQVSVHQGVAPFGTYMAVISRPPSDEGIEMSNEGCLRRCPVSEDGRSKGLLMAFEGAGARRDDGFEAESPSIASFS